jgi:hypothetical protein
VKKHSYKVIRKLPPVEVFTIWQLLNLFINFYVVHTEHVVTKIIYKHTNMCTRLIKLQHLEPKYASIQIKGNNHHSKKTKKVAISIRLKEELKFLYIKKQKLNEKLHQIHSICAKQWNGLWFDIQASIDYKLNSKFKKITIKKFRTMSHLAILWHWCMYSTTKTPPLYQRTSNLQILMVTSIRSESYNAVFWILFSSF